MSRESPSPGGRAAPVALVAPSGTGKTTLARRLVAGPGRYTFSVSVTTRAPRAGEVDGVDYRFVDRAAFQQMVREGHFAEWAEVHGRLYGTPKDELERAARRGEHVVLDIDVQGARQILEAVPGAKAVFVLPPDVDTLLARLRGRGTERRADVARRLGAALEELQAVGEFDYVVVNDELERCLEEIRRIAEGEGRGIGRAEAAKRAEELRAAIARALRYKGAGHVSAERSWEDI